MRIIRLKIKDTVKEVLAEMSRQFRTGDRGLVEDLYSLIRLKGNGLPSKARTEKIIQFLSTQGKIRPVSARIMVNKRVQVLKQATGMAYFKALTTMPDPVDAVNRLLTSFQKLYLKYREAQCKTCHLLTQCDFGKQYGDATPDVTRVADPDFSRKVNPACPVLPQIELAYQMSEAMSHLKQMAAQQPEAKLTGVKIDDEAEKDAEDAMMELDADDDLTDDSMDVEVDGVIFEGPSDGSKISIGGGTYRGSHDGREYVKEFENFVNRLTREQLMIFELGQKFGLALLQDKKGEFSPTEQMSQDRDQEKIEKLSDIPKLIASEHALPEELFQKKLIDRSLQKNQDMKRTQKRKLLYLLIDNSGSMRASIAGNAYRMLSRGALAVVFSNALSRRVRDDGGMVFCRFFAEGPTRRISAKEKSEFEPMMQLIAHASFDGGGTEVINAVRTAVKDIKSAQDEVAKSEIILISDCQDNFDAAAVKTALDGLPLNVLDVSGNSGLSYEGSKALKACANNYYKVNPKAVDITKIVEIV